MGDGGWERQQRVRATTKQCVHGGILPTQTFHDANDAQFGPSYPDEHVHVHKQVCRSCVPSRHRPLGKQYSLTSTRVHGVGEAVGNGVGFGVGISTHSVRPTIESAVHLPYAQTIHSWYTAAF
jgi:hypothetical protein